MCIRDSPLWEMQGATMGEDEASPNRCRTMNSTSALPGGCQCARSRLKQDELSSPVVGRLMPVVIRPGGPARRMTTGAERGGIQLNFKELSRATGAKLEIDAP